MGYATFRNLCVTRQMKIFLFLQSKMDIFAENPQIIWSYNL